MRLVNPNQPRDYDVVLGRPSLPPVGSVVLGGLEGVKQRLAYTPPSLREAAFTEALKYSPVGLDRVIQALNDESEQIQQAAYALLQKLALPKAEQALREHCNGRVQELRRRYAAGERNFNQVVLRGASLSGANLREANMIKTDLRETDLREAHLMSANLMKTDLREAKNLSQANLSGANLSEVNLSWVNMRRAYLNWVNLYGANLCGANLCGAYLIRTNLSGADLSGSTYDTTTIFPKGFSPNNAGAAAR